MNLKRKLFSPPDLIRMAKVLSVLVTLIFSMSGVAYGQCSVTAASGDLRIGPGGVDATDPCNPTVELCFEFTGTIGAGNVYDFANGCPQTLTVTSCAGSVDLVPVPMFDGVAITDCGILAIEPGTTAITLSGDATALMPGITDQTGGMIDSGVPVLDASFSTSDADNIIDLNEVISLIPVDTRCGQVFTGDLTPGGNPTVTGTNFSSDEPGTYTVTNTLAAACGMVTSTLDITVVGGSATVADPCSCTDPENVVVNDISYFHETIEVTNANVLAFEICALNAGQIYDNAGNALTLPLAPTSVVANPANAAENISTFEFWFEDNVGFDINICETSGTGEVLNESDFCRTSPVATFASNAEVCAGDVAVLTADCPGCAPGQVGPTVEWYADDGTGNPDFSTVLFTGEDFDPITLGLLAHGVDLGDFNFFSACVCDGCPSEPAMHRFTILAPIAAVAGACDCCTAGNPTVDITISGGFAAFDGSTYDLQLIGATADNTTPADGDNITITLDTDGGSWSLTVLDDLGCTTTISGQCDPCCTAEAGILSIGDQVLCDGEITMLTVSGEIMYPNVCDPVTGLPADDQDPTTGQYFYAAYFGSTGPVNTYYADFALALNDGFAINSGGTIINPVNIDNNGSSNANFNFDPFPTNEVITIVGLVQNELFTYPADPITLDATCGDVSDPVSFIVLDPITFNTSACACVDGNAEVVISSFAGGAPGAIAANGGPVMGLEQGTYTIVSNDGTIFDAGGIPTDTVGIGGSVTLQFPGGDTGSFMVMDEEGCVIENMLTCSPCGCNGGTLNSTDDIVCFGETLNLQALGVSFPADALITDNDAATGFYAWDFYFADATGNAANLTGPLPVNPYEDCGGALGNARDFGPVTSVLVANNIENMGSGGATTIGGAVLPTNTIIQVAGSAYNDAGAITCADSCALGYTQFVLLDPIAVADIADCDCTTGGSPTITLAGLAGGLPQFNGSSYSLNAVGAIFDNGLTSSTAAAGSDVTVTLDEDGGTWSVTISDMEGCDFFVSGACDPCCPADAGHLDVQDNVFCAGENILINAEDIGGYPINHNTIGAGAFPDEDGSGNTGLYVFDFYDATNPGLLITPNPYGTPGDIGTDTYAAQDVINDNETPFIEIGATTSGLTPVTIPANTLIAVTGSVHDDESDVLNGGSPTSSCQDAAEYVFFVRLDAISANIAGCACMPGQINPVVTLDGFAGGEPSALSALGNVFDLNDPNYYLTATGGTVSAATVQEGGSIEIEVTDANGDWSLTVQDDQGCGQVLTGNCPTCCILETSAIPLSETCSGSGSGSITVSINSNPNDLELEHALIPDGGTYDGTNALAFQTDTVFVDLAPGTYSVITRHTGDYSCTSEALDVVIDGGSGITPPTVTAATVCEFNGNSPVSGASALLSATCTFACPDGFPAGDVTWWTEEVGGSMVFSGADFDPVAEGLIDINMLSSTTYWAECSCGPCVSDRTSGTFNVVECCDVAITDVTATAPDCSGDAEGSIAITAASSSNAYEFALINGGGPFDGTNSGPFQTLPEFNGLPSGLYTVLIRDILNPVNCVQEFLDVLVPEGVVVEAPIVTEGYSCHYETAASTLLQADCSANDCGNFAGAISWWTENIGGTQIGVGPAIDPILMGLVNPNFIGTYTFWAQCECGPCDSERSPVTFTVRPIPEPQVIAGDNSVCPGETVTYSVAQVDDNTYTWSIPDGSGEFVDGINTGTDVAVTWSTDPPFGNGPYNLSVTEADNAGCSITYSKYVVIEINSQLYCNDQVNATLDQNCEILLYPDALLESPLYDDPSYMIHVTSGSGLVFSSSINAEGNYVPLVIDFKGLYTYNVEHICSGQACWGYILVEDKNDPEITCPADDPLDLVCSDVNEVFNPAETMIYNNMVDPVFDSTLITGNPVATDNCDMFSIAFSDELEEGGMCDPDVITRTFTVTDMAGNTSACKQIITVRKPTIPEVILPEVIELDCADVSDILPESLAQIDSVAANAFPSVPSYFGIHDINETYCNLGASYVDGPEIGLCGTGYKIIRTWTVFDWCTNESVIHNQIIKVSDTLAPDIVCPSYEDVEANQGNGECDAAVTILPLVSFTDNCSDSITTNVVITDSDGNETPTNIGDEVLLNVGAYTLTYYVADDCGNESVPCATTLNILDVTPPVAVCDANTVVSIGADGSAIACWGTFDDGSYDNCSEEIYIRIKRMDSPNNISFTECVEFDCSDVGSTILVRMRVYDVVPADGFEDDNDGRFNECMVVVNIQDKLAPMITCPDDKTLDCHADYSELDGLVASSNDGAYPAVYYNDNFMGYYPNASDNCHATIEVTDSGDVDNCGEGLITRTWTITDEGALSVSCDQLITLENQEPFTYEDIEWPADYTANCGNGEGLTPDALPEGYNYPILTSDVCDQIAVSHEDAYIYVSDTACYKILRRWIIVDWCSFNPEIFPYENGYYEHLQVIKVEDTTPPVINATCEDVTECNYQEDCSASFISLILDASDSCADNLNYSYQIDAFDDDVVDNGSAFNGESNDASGNFPVGTHHIYWSVEDGCGNITTCDYTFTIEDCKKPTPLLINGLSSVIMPVNGQLAFWANDFDAPNSASFDNCTAHEDLIFTIREVELDNLPLTTLDEVLALGSGVTFDCDDLGFTEVEVFVIDEAGNWESAITYLNLQDPNLACNPNTELADIAGDIYTEADDMVAEVTVDLSNPTVSVPPFLTEMDGHYEFNVNKNQNYTIAPERDGNPLNGVTTFDLVLIQKHILGITLLDSPYKIIAADANRSASLTTFDLVQIRRVILNIDEAFTNNTSWRFIDASFEFADPSNPFATNFPEIISINNLEENVMDNHFVAIKVGDVNASAIPNALVNTSSRETNGTLVFAVEDIDMAKGQTYEIAFDAKDFENIFGYQYTLSFDKNAIAFRDIYTGELASLSKDNFGLTLLNKGVVTTSWNNAKATSVENGSTLFTIEVEANANVKLSEVLSISSEYVQAEAYHSENELQDVAIAFNVASTTKVVTEGFELYQNRPNPFRNTTVISFNLPKSTTATLTITDAAGKVLKVIAGNYSKGYNEVSIQKESLEGVGILYYQLETASNIATRKMILIK